VLAERPLAGIQLYVVAPVAVSTVFEPEQIETPGLTPTAGRLFTDTVTDAVLLHPFVLVPVTV
jgi:hypothetical protein